MPIDLTEGEWAATAGPTSKLILELRWPSFGIRWERKGSSLISRRVKVEKSSERFLEADTTRIFNCGLYDEDVELRVTVQQPAHVCRAHPAFTNAAEGLDDEALGSVLEPVGQGEL
jgi:hypothetical protein